jgi:hypothetical protein
VASLRCRFVTLPVDQVLAQDEVVICMVTTRPPKMIVKPTALGPVADTDTKLLIYGFSKGPSFSAGREGSSKRRSRMGRCCDHRTRSAATFEQPARMPFGWQISPTLRRGKVSSTSRLSSAGRRSPLADNSVPVGISHVGIRRMAAAHWCDPVAPCFSASDAAVAVVVVLTERATAVGRGG